MVPIYNVFSRRNRPPPEKLTYDELPKPLRVACLRIIKEALADEDQLCSDIDAILEREHPVASFEDFRRRSGSPSFTEQCIRVGDFLEAMSAIEACALSINVAMRKPRSALSRASDPDDALTELNVRFQQYGVGYQFSPQTNQFVRINSEHMHAEVVAPAMRLLTEKGFEGPAQEFALAQRAYREGRGKDAVTEAVRAVESTAKAIMIARGWDYEKGDTIKRLLDKLFQNGLVPAELQSHFDNLRTALQTGLPTIGNNFARHGQGASVKPIGDHMVTLGLHLAAATIRFLVEAHRIPCEKGDELPARDVEVN
jgi:hypothetical protein